MPKLSQEQLIKEFYETIKDQYPQVDLNMCMDICKSPFIFIRKCISGSMVLPDIVVKYLGKFRMTLGRIRTMKAAASHNAQVGNITAEEFQSLYDMLSTREELIKEIKKTKHKTRKTNSNDDISDDEEFDSEEESTY